MTGHIVGRCWQVQDWQITRRLSSQARRYTLQLNLATVRQIGKTHSFYNPDSPQLAPRAGGVW